MPPSEGVPHVAPPWKLKGTIYAFISYSTSKSASAHETNKDFFYSPLELDSSFSNGRFLGGLGMVQVIRYTESPVGPYDELLLVPGDFAYQVGSGEVAEKKKNLRITRIYVSQKETCWNGRTNWNIPKHLAEFTFNNLSNGAISIAVRPMEDGNGLSESPYFSATFKPIPYLPSIPMSTSIAKYIGLDLTLVQPPLPAGKSQELAGTDRWCSIVPGESSRKVAVGWWDLKQGGSTEDDALLDGTRAPTEVKEGYENWWPGSGRWKIGIVMEDAHIDFPDGKYWVSPNL